MMIIAVLAALMIAVGFPWLGLPALWFIGSLFIRRRRARMVRQERARARAEAEQRRFRAMLAAARSLP